MTPSHPAGTATKVIVPQKPAFAASKGRGHEKTAQHKVIICHRTGSATNPYVAINVSINAWLNGHSKHPALDGRSDILLQDPASPGEKPDPALVAELCGGGQQAAQQQSAPAPAQLATAAPAKSRLAIVAAAGVKGAAASQPKGAAGVLLTLSRGGALGLLVGSAGVLLAGVWRRRRKSEVNAVHIPEGEVNVVHLPGKQRLLPRRASKRRLLRGPVAAGLALGMAAAAAIWVAPGAFAERAADPLAGTWRN